jgi:O-antigen/teichoic acid export membrane protein
VTKNSNNTVQVFWIGIGSFSSFAISLVSAAILSRYFSKAEYGTYKQILYVYDTLLIVFTAGLPRVFNYFLPRYTLTQGKEIVLKISKVLFLSGLAFSVFLFAFSGVIADILKNPELSRGLKYFSPVPMLLLPTLGIEGIFSTYKKTVFIAIYDTLTRTLMFIFIIVPVMVFSKNYITAIYGWITVSVIILIIASFYKGIPFKGVKQEKSGLSFKEILKYSLPLVSATIAAVIFRAANQFYISRYFGSEVFAEFSNGFVEIPFVQMIIGATSTVLMPVFSKIVYEKSDMSQITNLWRSTLQKSAILIYPIVIFFMFYSKEVVTIIYSETYSISSKYFSTALILNFFNIIIFAPLLLSFGKVKFYARLHYGLAITAWVVEYLVIIIFKTPLAVAISFVAISVCGLVISLVYSSKILGVSFLSLFPAGRFLVIAIHSFISLFLVNFLLRHFLPHTIDLVFVTIAGIGYLGVLLISSKLVKINYMEIIIPLIQKKK